MGAAAKFLPWVSSGASAGKRVRGGWASCARRGPAESSKSAVNAAETVQRRVTCDPPVVERRRRNRVSNGYARAGIEGFVGYSARDICFETRTDASHATHTESPRTHRRQKPRNPQDFSRTP